MHVITPTDLKSFQLENYKEMLLKPRNEKHEKFLKNQIKLLQNDTPIQNLFDNLGPLCSLLNWSGNISNNRTPKRMEGREKIYGRF